MLIIWVWKARSVEQDAQRRVGAWARERRRVEGVMGEVGEVEREGGSEDVGDDGGEEDEELRRRRKGMRSAGRR